MQVYAAIAKVSAALAKSGISKDKRNQQQGYNFRGIDDVYNALAPALAEHGLVILPRVLSRAVTERTTQKGGVLLYVVVEVEFDIVSSEDGSKHTIKTYGEAMDSADKATNKAMSAAYKYAAMQTFCIPTEGEDDADQTTPDETAPEMPDGFEQWWADIQAVADNGQDALRDAWRKSPEAYRNHLTATSLKAWEATKVRAAKVKAA